MPCSVHNIALTLAKNFRFFKDFQPQKNGSQLAVLTVQIKSFAAILKKIVNK
jgi:hypothetical protein